jgi:hypothetical protein
LWRRHSDDVIVCLHLQLQQPWTPHASLFLFPGHFWINSQTELTCFYSLLTLWLLNLQLQRHSRIRLERFFKVEEDIFGFGLFVCLFILVCLFVCEAPGESNTGLKPWQRLTHKANHSAVCKFCNAGIVTHIVGLDPGANPTTFEITATTPAL